MRTAPEQWLPVHRTRWDWADAAFSQFASGLDGGLARGLSGRDDRHYNAVLYGKSQTGKTTLILRMLGLDREGQDVVAGVLRAGRGAGHSSTAVASRYRWSHHPELWEVAELGTPSELISQSEAGDRLSRYRNVHGQLTRPNGYVEVGIPTRYRGPSDDDSFPSILDLPGVDALDPAEREHARALVARHVPRAHLVILVAAANDLTPLFRGEHDDLMVWTRVPERFRVVITHTYSQDSVRAQLGSGVHMTPDGIRDHVVAQMMRSAPRRVSRDDANRARIKAVVYPVEFGDSWRRMQNEDPRVFDSAAPLVEHFLTELTADVGPVASEDAGRIAFAHTRTIVKLAAEEESLKLERRSRAAERQLQKARAALRDQEGVVRRASCRLEFLRRQQELLERALADPPDFVSEMRRSTRVTRRRDVESLGAKFRLDLGKGWSDAWKDWADSDTVLRLATETQTPVPCMPDVGEAFLKEWHCGACVCRLSWDGRAHKPISKASVCSDRMIHARTQANARASEQAASLQAEWGRSTGAELGRRCAVSEALLLQMQTDLRILTERVVAAELRVDLAVQRTEEQQLLAQQAERDADEFFGQLNARLDEERRGRTDRLAAIRDRAAQASEALGILLILRQRDLLNLEDRR